MDQHSRPTPEDARAAAHDDVIVEIMFRTGRYRASWGRPFIGRDLADYYRPGRDPTLGELFEIDISLAEARELMEVGRRVRFVGDGPDPRETVEPPGE